MCGGETPPDPPSASGGLAGATGQGRWGLYVMRPSQMIEYYRQAPLDEKLDTSDLRLVKPLRRIKSE